MKKMLTFLAGSSIVLVSLGTSRIVHANSNNMFANPEFKLSIQGNTESGASISKMPGWTTFNDDFLMDKNPLVPIIDNNPDTLFVYRTFNLDTVHNKFYQFSDKSKYYLSDTGRQHMALSPQISTEKGQAINLWEEPIGNGEFKVNGVGQMVHVTKGHTYKFSVTMTSNELQIIDASSSIRTVTAAADAQDIDLDGVDEQGNPYLGTDFAHLTHSGNDYSIDFTPDKTMNLSLYLVPDPGEPGTLHDPMCFELRNPTLIDESLKASQ